MQVRTLFLQPTTNLGILQTDVVDLARIVDRRSFVILAIMNKRLMNKHNPFRTCPNLEIECSVLVRRTGSFQKSKVVLADKIRAVNSRPQSRLRIKTMLVVANARIDHPIALMVSKQLKKMIILDFLCPVQVKFALTTSRSNASA